MVYELIYCKIIILLNIFNYLDEKITILCKENLKNITESINSGNIYIKEMPFFLELKKE